MSAPISPITAPAQIDIARTTPSAGSVNPSGEFRGVLAGAIESVEKTRNQAGQAVDSFLSGDGQELHSAILATQRADLAFELGLQVRNKVVQAYQEIMRMQM